MPIYVYACDACGANFEKLQGFHDEPIRTCPSCQGSVRRVLQPAGIVFKGSGWYINDSRPSSASKTETSKANVASSTTAESAASSTPSEANPGSAASSPEPASASASTSAPAAASAPASTSTKSGAATT